MKATDEKSTTATTATVLAADDFAANRNLLRETLEPHGYEVPRVDNGETAAKVAGCARESV